MDDATDTGACGELPVGCSGADLEAVEVGDEQETLQPQDQSLGTWKTEATLESL